MPSSMDAHMTSLRRFNAKRIASEPLEARRSTHHSESLSKAGLDHDHITTYTGTSRARGVPPGLHRAIERGQKVPVDPRDSPRLPSTP
jgi:hypothetical protein